MLTAADAAKMAASADPDIHHKRCVKEAHDAIRRASEEGRYEHLFWSYAAHHPALPHSVQDELRKAGYHVSTRDLGSVQVSWHPKKGSAGDT
jgi:hypothetical protein